MSVAGDEKSNAASLRDPTITDARVNCYRCVSLHLIAGRRLDVTGRRWAEMIDQMIYARRANSRLVSA